MEAKEHLTVDDCLKLYEEEGIVGLVEKVKEISSKAATINRLKSQHKLTGISFLFLLQEINKREGTVCYFYTEKKGNFMGEADTMEAAFNKCLEQIEK